MATIFIDTETFSPVPIAHGVHAYAEKAEVMLLAYAVNDGPIGVIDLTLDCIGASQADLLNRLNNGDETVVIHNSAFDLPVLRHALSVNISTDRVHDTMIQALAHSLPGSLGTLSEIFALSVEQAKNKEGRKLIQLFCKPNAKGGRNTRETHPKQWQQFIEYAGRDIDAMRAIYHRMPRWNFNYRERALWRLDRKINERGFAVDTQLARSAITAVERAQKELARRTSTATLGLVDSTTRRDAILRHLLDAYGISLPDLTASTIERRMNDDSLPAPVREILAIRLQSSQSSTSKYTALVNAVSSDGRLRGTLQFCGASRTGRWSGRTFQPQNLARPDMEHGAIEQGIEALRLGCAELITDDVIRLAKNAIRGCIVAPKGRKLVIADLSNIEGRVLAWLAGERWKLDAFRAFDSGEGHDLYKLAYARSFAITPENVTKEQRQLGKVQELALGYQGAVGAFSSMAALYGVELPEEKVLELVKAWRKANANIVSFWYDLEDTVKKAIQENGQNTFICRKVKVCRDKNWLRIILPSGRSLCYPSPRVEGNKISYMGMNQYSRKWERITTYGGKLVENCTQAVARDVMAENMPRVEDDGYEIVLSVHDELITEVPENTLYKGSLVDRLTVLLATNPSWAEDLPLAAGGFECTRYRKE